jgi:uncharacterized iron-regulated protein
MKSWRLFLPLFLVVSLVQSASASERIFDVRERREIPREEFLLRIAGVDELVVGEKHDTPSVQNAEARLFAEFAKQRKTPVTFAWEFWNWSDRYKLDSVYREFADGIIDGKKFLRWMFGQSNPQLTYLPVMEAVKRAGAKVLPLNLTRDEKAPVVQGGISRVDPELLPPGFEMGGKGYLARFIAAMGGHGDPTMIANYFAAQCLVDDVAAFHFARDRETGDGFMIIGGFHSRYFDGVWKRLEKRSPGRSRLLVEIGEIGDEQDWEAVMNHEKFGPAADFVILLSAE